MDTLSGSVSSFKSPALPSTPRGLIQLRAPTNTVPHLLLLPPPQQPQLSSTTIKPTTFIHNNNNSNIPNSPLFFSSPSKLSPLTHQTQRAAAGYAAALVDIAQSNNLLQLVQRDVRRFTKLLRNKQVQAFLADPLVDEKEKGQIIVKEMAEKGKFHRHLVALLKMLVEKTKLGLVGEVLDEFHTMYDYLSGNY